MSFAGIKFFSKSKNLYADGTTISATNSDASAPRCIDRNPFSYYRSVGSTDAETITIEITFPESSTIDRVLLVDHNWKQFTVKYWSGAAYANFTSVVGIDGSLGSGISETVFADDTAYYEFAEVTTTKLEVTVTATQTANQQKYIQQIIACEELGTLVGYPTIKATTHSRNARNHKMLSGKILTMKSEESFSVNLDFDNYPASSTYSADIDLMFSLYDREELFQIWICGGRRGTTYFKKQMKGYRLKDIYTVQASDPIKPIYSGNVYKNTVNFSIGFDEAVD